MSYFAKFNRGGIPFMEGADKASFDEILDVELHIADYGFIKGDEGEYACIQIAEKPGKFYFANSIITEMLKEVERDGHKDELPTEVIVFSKRKSEKGRDYYAYEFPYAEA